MSTNRPEAFKNDFPNALRRNLHNWAQWRVDVNDQLVTSLMTGQRNVEVEPLGKYLHNSKHPTENPSTLLAYSASTDNISSLGMRRFLHYGIPRAKVSSHGRRQSELSSQPPSTYTIHEHPEEFSYESNDRLGHMEYFDPPYHPPEPEPDYDKDKYSDGRIDNFSDIDPDNITAPGSSSSSTDSSDTETLYAEQPLPATSYRTSNLTSNRRPISRTYSTLNALDPIYMTQKSKNTLHGKLTKKKPAPHPPPEPTLDTVIPPPVQPPPLRHPPQAPPPGPEYFFQRHSGYDSHHDVYGGPDPHTAHRMSAGYRAMYY